MNDVNQRRTPRYGAVATAASFLVGAVVILWSWNTIAVDLFGAPNVALRHAIAIELAVAVVGIAIGFIARLAGGGRQTGAVS
jgi:hypothetical protein